MAQAIQVNGDYKVKVTDNGTIYLDSNDGVGQVNVLGLLTAKGTPDYLQRIRDDDDIPNKLYVDTLAGTDVGNSIYVTKRGNDTNTGKTLAQAKLTIKAALDLAATLNSPATVFVYPGVYVEDGELEIPANSNVVGVGGQYITEVHASPGNESKNMFLVNSGSYVQGFAFRNQRIDNFNNPSGGFAIAFAPGAVIFRSPYIRDISQVSNYSNLAVAAPLEPIPAGFSFESNDYAVEPNPLVGAGGGVLLADRAVLNPDSVFTYMLAFGATPRSPNGIGYCAKNGGGINGISSMTIFQQCSFFALNGGQITLNNSGTQFGDISLRATGSTTIIRPLDSQPDTLYKLPAIAELIEVSAQNIINNMWSELDNSFPGLFDTVEEITRRDAGKFIESIAFDLKGKSSAISKSFVLSLFDYRARFVFRPEFYVGFIYSYQYIRESIFDLINLSDNKTLFKKEITKFIIERFSDLEYDQVLCERDVVLILDAIGYDLLFGSNYRTISAARSYYRKGAQEVIDNQKEATIASYQLLKQLASDSVTNSNAKIFIEDASDLLINIIDDGTGVIPAYVIPVPTSGSNNASDAGYLNARNNIQINRTFIIEEVIASIDNQLVYDELKCREDLDFILDALYYDLTYGGNLETTVAAKAYFSKAVAQLGSVDEKTATLAAYQYLSQLVETVALDQAVTSTVQSVVTQTITGNAGSTAAATFAENRILEIRAFIDGDGLIAITEIVPDTAWVTAALLEANDQLIEQGIKNLALKMLQDLIGFASNETNITIQITKFIKNDFPELEYDQVLCERDVGLILDAIGYDLLFGSNYRTIAAARSYYRKGAEEVIDNQKAATVASYQLLKQLASDSVDNASAKTFIENNIDLLINIIDDGTGVIPAYVIPVPSSGSNNASDAGYLNARNNIETNRSFIIEEVIASIDNQLVYDELKCREDLDFILDALYYDLTYGGNLETTVAAKAYFSKAVAQLGSVDEKTATLAAYQYLSQLVEAVALNQAVTPTEQLVVTQTLTGNAGSAAAATFAKDRILEIRAFIDGNGLIAITKIVPDTAWVTAALLEANDQLLAPSSGIIIGTIEQKESLEFEFSSLIESLGHQFNNAGAGVNKNALPLNFRRPGQNRPVPFSVLEQGGGQVRWSGADEFNNQYFAGGTKINGLTGRFEGRPFNSAVRQIARRLANSRAII